MKIDIKAKNLELTSELEEFIREKISSLGKFEEMPEISVFVEKETNHHKKGDIFVAKSEIILPGKKIMAKSESEDVLSSVVEIKDRLQQEIKKYKTKHIEFSRREQRKLEK